MIAFVVGVLGWAWGGVAPLAAWLWWNVIAVAIQALLHGCGVMYLLERGERWWTGRG